MATIDADHAELSRRLKVYTGHCRRHVWHPCIDLPVLRLTRLDESFPTVHGTWSKAAGSPVSGSVWPMDGPGSVWPMDGPGSVWLMDGPGSLWPMDGPGSLLPMDGPVAQWSAGLWPR